MKLLLAGMALGFVLGRASCNGEWYRQIVTVPFHRNGRPAPHLCA